MAPRSFAQQQEWTLRRITTTLRTTDRVTHTRRVMAVALAMEVQLILRFLPSLVALLLPLPLVLLLLPLALLPQCPLPALSLSPLPLPLLLLTTARCQRNLLKGRWRLIGTMSTAPTASRATQWLTSPRNKFTAIPPCPHSPFPVLGCLSFHHKINQLFGSVFETYSLLKRVVVDSSTWSMSMPNTNTNAVSTHLSSSTHGVPLAEMTIERETRVSVRRR